MVVLECAGMEKRLTDREREFRLTVPEFSVNENERKAIVGSTGSGKTTVMDILAMVTEADRCEYFRLRYGNETVDLARAIRRKRVLTGLRAACFGYIMQKSPLFPFLTVAENIAVQQQISKRRDRRYADTLMGMLGIEMLSDALPAELSVGQRQRAAIARSLSHRPSVILCDEPTGALDPVTAKQAMETLLWAGEQSGAAIVMISHDWSLARQFGFSFYVMQTEFRQGLTTANILLPLDRADGSRNA